MKVSAHIGKGALEEDTSSSFFLELGICKKEGDALVVDEGSTYNKSAKLGVLRTQREF